MLLLAVVVGAMAVFTPPANPDWAQIAPGMEMRWILAKAPSFLGDSRITVVRVDPSVWQLVLVSRSQTGDPEGRTAREWAESHGLVLATNAGMFATDYSTHVGYMESRGHVNSAAVNAYQSVAAFDPRDPGRTPPFRIFDLDREGVSIGSIRQDYASLVQNLRLIRRPGENRWSRQEKRWSEAALGEDEDGRILFVFCRSPFSMHDLNRELLGASIGLVALQHLEGGPEAQLYLRVGDRELDLFGSYETSFKEDDENEAPWPIPNVIGLVPAQGLDGVPSNGSTGGTPGQGRQASPSPRNQNGRSFSP